jgi:protein involved in polysaccharide export with SLBB domain
VSLCGAGLLLALGLLCAGCDMLGLDADRLQAGFLAPGEMMRANLRQPLMKPILETLSSGFDEPNEEYPNARNVEASDLVASGRDYVIGRNDLLQLTMTEVTPGTETQKTSRVSESGNITLPLIGQVRAVGLTEAELEAAIRDAFQKSGMIKTAQVSVTVLEARQKTFQIRGAVAQPGQYAIPQS